MQILSLEYEDNLRHWKLERMDFHPLTLIVGASGVGKTEVLRALATMNQIASGSTMAGAKWRIEFFVKPDSRYVWAGEFSYISRYRNNQPRIDGYESKIVKEEIWLNQALIVSRDVEKSYLLGKETFRLPSEKSMLYLLKEEENISPAFYGLQSIRFSDSTYSNIDVTLNRLLKRTLTAGWEHLDSLDKIKASNESALGKLYLVQYFLPTLFSEIVETYKEIFPFVQQMRLVGQEAYLGDGDVNLTLQLMEEGSDWWIEQNTISTGMFRTLLHISELYLLSTGSVILIDEFENSLGVNCIDEVTQLIISNANSQFILTSHHPYVINQISFKNWKLLTRKGGVVTGHDVEELGFGKSKHQAFMQLINLDEFSEGVTV